MKFLIVCLAFAIAAVSGQGVERSYLPPAQEEPITKYLPPNDGPTAPQNIAPPQQFQSAPAPQPQYQPAPAPQQQYQPAPAPQQQYQPAPAPQQQYQPAPAPQQQYQPAPQPGPAADFNEQDGYSYHVPGRK